MRGHDTIPTGDRSHAAFVACRAARAARLSGADELGARQAYDVAYGAALNEGKVAA